MFKIAASIAIAGVAWSVSAADAQAATLNVNTDGLLVGAYDVDVGGVLYDVDFIDGICEEIFDGCDDNSDFTFNNLIANELARTALIEQVFIGEFNLDPSKTIGCTTTDFFCQAMIPLNIRLEGSGAPAGLSVGVAINEPGLSNRTDGFGWSTGSKTDSREYPYNVWAKFSEPVATTPIPLPAGGWLILSGLIALISVRPKKAVAQKV